MNRAPYVDLAYTHEMLVAPVQPDPAAIAQQDACDLVARLRCLKTLMDAERSAAPPPLDTAARQRVH